MFGDLEKVMRWQPPSTGRHLYRVLVSPFTLPISHSVVLKVSEGIPPLHPSLGYEGLGPGTLHLWANASPLSLLRCGAESSDTVIDAFGDIKNGSPEAYELCPLLSKLQPKFLLASGLWYNIEEARAHLLGGVVDALLSPREDISTVKDDLGHVLKAASLQDIAAAVAERKGNEGVFEPGFRAAVGTLCALAESDHNSAALGILEGLRDGE